MSFQFSSFDSDGTPTRVNIDDGYMQTSRPFNKEEDGWMLDQLDVSEFDAISTGRQMEFLVSEVNRLKRENYRLNRMVDTSIR